MDFLNTGKGLYIEGPDFGYDNSSTELYKKFGCVWLGDGEASGNVQTITGQSGTIVEGLSFNYLYAQGPDYYVDYIGEDGGTLIFRCQSGNGRVITYDGPSDEYRAIHSTVIFGALRNGTHSKNGLMDTYMEYLLSGPVGVEEHDVSKTVDKISIFPNPAFKTVNLRFVLSQPGRVKIRVYNTAGQLVRHLVDRVFTVSDYQLIWDGADDSGKRLSSGCYVVRIETDREATSEMITFVK